MGRIAAGRRLRSDLPAHRASRRSGLNVGPVLLSSALAVGVLASGAGHVAGDYRLRLGSWAMASAGPRAGADARGLPRRGADEPAARRPALRHRPENRGRTRGAVPPPRPE